MNRRSFLKSAALAAVAVPVVGLPEAVPVTVPVKSPATSILLQWYYPGDPRSCDHKYWNTPTLKAWQDAKFDASLLWATMAGRGYKVDYHEFDVIRFIHKQ